MTYNNLLESLKKRNTFLFSGKFEEKNLGLIDTNTLEDFLTGLSSQKTEGILNAIQKFNTPSLIHLPYLISLARESDSLSSEDIKRACYRFHGTDGLRSMMAFPEGEISLEQAVRIFIREKKITPLLFEALTRNTIRAYEIFHNHSPHLLIGCDPRDLYSDNKKKEKLFYKAVQKGACYAEKAYDIGIAPIPCIPYMLAYFDNKNEIPVDLVIYKSASHNPASQDGIKVFVRRSSGAYYKASVELELVITALLYKEAISEVQMRKKGELRNISSLAHTVFSRTALDNIPKIHNVAYIVSDLAHGAFSWKEYQNTIAQVIKNTGIETFKLVGNKPNGKNINNNEGEDRVGASHFENIFSIDEEDIRKGEKFYGFPALTQLVNYAKTHKQEDEKTFWAIFTDGDGDRSYSVLYNPFKKCFYVIDGDKSFFYQIVKYIANKKVKNGDTLAFTVESNITFMNAVITYLKKFFEVNFILGDGASQEDKVNIKLTPVGDKYILENQCVGAESTGHLIKPYTVLSSDNKTLHRVYAGNGVLSSLETVSAIDQILTGENQSFELPETFSDKLVHLASPYQEPCNSIVYIYFISKSLWYRGSKLWESIDQHITQACLPHILKEVEFSEEPDTLYYLCSDKNERFIFSILARPSGTENKFGIKFFGSKETQAFFTTISDQLFVEIAPLIKEKDLQVVKDEQKILEFVENNKKVTVEELKTILETETSTDKAYLMTIVDAISDKCQALANYDGNTLRANERTQKYLKRLSNIAH